MSISSMPEIREWEGREFSTDRRALEVAAGRPRERENRVPDSYRTNDQSPNPCQKLLDYAEQFRRDGPSGLVVWPDRKALRRLAECCLSHSDLLGRSSRHADALIAALSHWRDWLRPLDNWEPPDEEARGQFGSLARHLFARFDVPRFLDAAWLAGLGGEGIRYQTWYKQIGRGESIGSLADLPIPLNRAMAHAFVHAPDDLDLPSALRWAQVCGMGGDERLVRTVLDGRIGVDFRDDEFWTGVIRWLIARPDLDPRHHGPIIDYLHDQKFVPSVANPQSRRRGLARQPLAIPPQPNLCMRGRTTESLLRAVEEWHRLLGSERRGVSVEWKPSSISPFSGSVGAGPSRRAFSITELICSDELQEEGQAMGHCVATYWRLCASGQCSIWALTSEDCSGETTRLLTLEVRPADRQIAQARGPENREPTDEERFILALWSNSGGPSPGRYLLDLPPIEG